MSERMNWWVDEWLFEWGKLWLCKRASDLLRNKFWFSYNNPFQRPYKILFNTADHSVTSQPPSWHSNCDARGISTTLQRTTIFPFFSFDFVRQRVVERDGKGLISLFFRGKGEEPLRSHLELVSFFLFVQEGEINF